MLVEVSAEALNASQAANDQAQKMSITEREPRTGQSPEPQQYRVIGTRPVRPDSLSRVPGANRPIRLIAPRSPARRPARSSGESRANRLLAPDLHAR
jgi:hypothetical protein